MGKVFAFSVSLESSFTPILASFDLRSAKLALCQLPWNATAGCSTVRSNTARTTMAPSRIMNVTSSLASEPSNPCCSSATRKQERTKMNMVAAARATKR